MQEWGSALESALRSSELVQRSRALALDSVQVWATVQQRQAESIAYEEKGTKAGKVENTKCVCVMYRSDLTIVEQSFLDLRH
jgi:hypothetical protein